MSQHTVTSFRRRETQESAQLGVRVAAAVIAACFVVHALNGLLLERLFLDLESYTDYADLALVRDAFDSPSWILSSVGHLVTSALVVVLVVSLARLAADTQPVLATYLRVAGGVAAGGYLLLAVTGLQAARTTSLLAEENPELGDTVFAALTVVNVAANGVAVAAMGAVVLLVGRYGRAEGWPRWFWRLTLVTAAAGVLQAIVYLPLFVVLGLAWFVSLFVLTGRDG